MADCYQHLQPQERQTLASLHQQRYSLRSIAGILGRSASTVHRELLRNSHAQKGYAAFIAQESYQSRRKAAKPIHKLDYGGPLWRKVCLLLDECWSPCQIAHWLKRQHPHDTKLHACPESIYKAIYAYPLGPRRRYLIARLRQGRSKRKRRSRGKDRRGHIVGMQSIHVRPSDVQARQTCGHWEGDLIKGKDNRSAIGVLVERLSRRVMLCKLPDASTASVVDAFATRFREVPRSLLHTLTYDQGREMALHQELSQRTGLSIYFCDAHSPWQRGTCENTNGLLRQFLPKGTDLSVHSQSELDAIARCLNNRPRQVLDWLTPNQVFNAYMAETLGKPSFFDLAGMAVLKF